MDRAGSASETRAEIEQEALKTSQGVPRADMAGLPASAVEIGLWERAAVAVLILTSVLFFARLGVRALWASEFRWAEIAREMIVTHNYFWPTINGRVYYDKPLGSYWLVVASTWLTGGMNEAAARIPCAIAGVLAVALMVVIVRRLYDLRTAVITAFILATSFSFVFFSRHASADVETVTGELAALALFLRNEDRPVGWWVAGLWLIMAATSLTKGLLGFVLPVLIIATYSCLADGWGELGRRLMRGALAERIRWIVGRNRWFFNWRTGIAVAIGFAVYYTPFAMSRMESGATTGLQMVYRENVERYFDPFDHRGPVYLYVYVIFALMAPWSAFLPAALVEAHQRRRNRADQARSDRFVLAFFWSVFIFFTVSGSRRSYYILPILPAAAILVARVLSEPLETLAVWPQRLMKLGYAIIAGAVVISALAFLPPHWILPEPWAQLPMAPDQAMFAIYWIVSIAALLYGVKSFSSERIAVSVGVVAYFFMVYFFVFAMPAGDAYRGEKSFAYHARQLIGRDTAELAFYKNQGPAFYLDLPKPVPEYDRLGDLDAAIKAGSVRWLVVRRRELPTINIPAEVVTSEMTNPWDAKEHRLNTMVLVRIESGAR
jgi:4-amino-4-deoxy-L-arabinose transferase-like glycosyltransferase